MRYFIQATLVSIMVFLCAPAVSQTFKEGVHYDVIDGVDQANDDGLVEFYSLYCSYCYRYEPIADAMKTAFADQFSKVHVASVAPSPEAGSTMTRAYILAQKMDIAEKINRVMFDYNFKKGHLLREPDDIRNVFIVNGIDGQTFDKGIASFAVTARFNQWQRLIDKLGVRATPTFVVNGKYRINPTSLRDSDDLTASLINLAGYLLEKE